VCAGGYQIGAAPFEEPPAVCVAHASGSDGLKALRFQLKLLNVQSGSTVESTGKLEASAADYLLPLVRVRLSDLHLKESLFEGRQQANLRCRPVLPVTPFLTSCKIPCICTAAAIHKA